MVRDKGMLCSSREERQNTSQGLRSYSMYWGFMIQQKTVWISKGFVLPYFLSNICRTKKGGEAYSIEMIKDNGWTWEGDDMVGDFKWYP